MPEWNSLPPEVQKHIIEAVERFVREYASRQDIFIKIAIALAIFAVVATGICGFIFWRRLVRVSTEQKKLEGEVRLNEVAARNADLQYLKDVHEAKELCSKSERELEAIIMEMMTAMDANNKHGIISSRERGLGFFSREYSSSYAHFVEIKSLQFTAGKKESAKNFINGSIIPWLKAAASFIETFNNDSILKPLGAAPYVLPPSYFSDVFGFLDAHLDPSWSAEAAQIKSICAQLEKWVQR